MVIHEIRVSIILPSISKDTGNHPIVEHVHNEENPINDQQLHNEIITNHNVDEVPQELALRRSQRQRRSTIPDDYMLYLIESEGITCSPIENQVTYR